MSAPRPAPTTQKDPSPPVDTARSECDHSGPRNTAGIPNLAAAFLDDAAQVLHLGPAAGHLLECGTTKLASLPEALAALTRLDGSTVSRSDLCEHPLLVRTPSGAKLQLVLCPAPGGHSLAIQSVPDGAPAPAAAAALLERSTEVLALLDRNGTILWASPAMAALHGISAQEAVGSSGFSFVHPEDIDRLTEELQWRAQTPGPHRSLVYRAAHADGTWRHLEMRSTNLLHDPDVQAIVVAISDITDAARRLRASAELAAAVEAIAAGHDPTEVADRLERAGNHFISYEHPGRALRRLFDLTTEIAESATCASGPTRARRWVIDGVDDLTQHDQALMSTLTPLTDLLVAVGADRDRIESLRAQYGSAFANNPVPAAIVSVEGHYLMVNEAMVELTGLPAAELTRRGWRDLLHPQEPAPPDPPLTGDRADLPNMSLRSRWLLPDGRDVWVQVNVSAAIDHRMQLRYHVVTYHDVTEEEQRVQALQEVNGHLQQRATLTAAERDHLTALVASLADDRERERATWATRLTEEAVQQLVGTRFALDALNGDGADPAVGQASGLLESVITELRDTAGAMRPPTLDLFGLEPTLRNAGDSLAAGGVQTETALQVLPRLREDDEILLYRAVMMGVATGTRPGVARTELTLTLEQGSEQGDAVLARYLDDGPRADQALDPTAASSLAAQFTHRGGALYAGPRRDGGPGLEISAALPVRLRD